MAMSLSMMQFTLYTEPSTILNIYKDLIDIYLDIGITGYTLPNFRFIGKPC